MKLMPANKSSQSTQLSKPVRYILGFLLLLLAITAFAGGYYGMTGAKDIPVEWLDGTPFSSYFLPSLFLFLVIGGTCLFATIAIFKSHPLGTKIAFLSATIIILWLIIQVAIIGYVSWMQPATASIALVIIFLTFITPVNAF